MPDGREQIDAANRLIVALDVPDLASARQMIEAIGPTVMTYKIGLQLQYGGGIDLIRELRDTGRNVFLDAKLHDIEQTVASAVANISSLGVDFLTIHARPKVVRAAVAGRANPEMKLMGVTVLTNLDDADLAASGIRMPAEDLVLLRAKQAMEGGADGVIASGLEAARIRAATSSDFLIITPGIRSAGAARHDQKRVTTPREAIEAGSDYLVVGREITASDNPGGAADRIVAEIAQALE